MLREVMEAEVSAAAAADWYQRSDERVARRNAIAQGVGHAGGDGRAGDPPDDRLETPAAKVATLLAEAEDDLLAFLSFPLEHRSKLRSTNPLERGNREIARRSDAVGIFPNDQSLIRLAGCLLIEQSDEGLVTERYLSQESLASLYATRTSAAHSSTPASQLSVGALAGVEKRAGTHHDHLTGDPDPLHKSALD